MPYHSSLRIRERMSREIRETPLLKTTTFGSFPKMTGGIMGGMVGGIVKRGLRLMTQEGGVKRPLGPESKRGGGGDP